MAKRIKVKGPIISRDEKWIYDWFEYDSTTVDDIEGELPTDGSPIEVAINSPGGYVDEGSEIYYLLKNYKGHVTTDIVGTAASAASIIAMAGDTVRISPTGQIMIHNVSGGARGDYRDLYHEAGVLENFNKSIANAYRLKTGISENELLDFMNKETWLNAQQAREMGFVDEILFDNGKLVASAQSGMIPIDVLNKMKNMKDQLSIGNQPETINENNLNDNQLEFAKAKLKNTILGGYKYAKKH
ncbi:head maturation protease, ClpP-related [Neobacillus sp. NPDC093127]|uniref:head maturation protease, ClpP-related n=1 Tax=Neobacillus sp. NPDC093127 TaxID=3364296 RepID=UPI0038104302